MHYAHIHRVKITFFGGNIMKCTSTPGYSSFLHVSDVDTVGAQKIAGFLRKVCKKFTAFYYPAYSMSIDETCIGMPFKYIKLFY